MVAPILFANRLPTPLSRWLVYRSSLHSDGHTNRMVDIGQRPENLSSGWRAKLWLDPALVGARPRRLGRRRFELSLKLLLARTILASVYLGV